MPAPDQSSSAADQTMSALWLPMFAFGLACFSLGFSIGEAFQRWKLRRRVKRNRPGSGCR